MRAGTFDVAVKNCVVIVVAGSKCKKIFTGLRYAIAKKLDLYVA